MFSDEKHCASIGKKINKASFYLYTPMEMEKRQRQRCRCCFIYSLYRAGESSETIQDKNWHERRESASEGLNRLCPSQKDRRLQLLAEGGDDEATEGFVGFLGAMGRTRGTKSRVLVPFAKPFIVFNRITQIGVGFG